MKIVESQLLARSTDIVDTPCERFCDAIELLAWLNLAIYAVLVDVRRQ